MKISGELLKAELKKKGLSIRRIGNKYSPEYIGVSDRTIGRCIRDGHMTIKTLDALSKVVDINAFIIEDDDIKQESIVDRLAIENAKLNHDLNLKDNYISALEKTIDHQKTQLLESKNVIHRGITKDEANAIAVAYARLDQAFKDYRDLVGKMLRKYGE